MNGEGRQTGSYGDELTNAAMIGLVALFGVALVLRGAGSVAAWITGTNQPLVAPPPASVCCSIPVIPSPVAYWIVAGLLLTGLVVGGVWAWSWLRLHNHRVEQDPRRMAGVATRSEVTVAASEKALLRRAANLRPDLSNPRPQDVGYRLGTSKGTSVWASVEDSIMVIGPPRSGKGLHLVIPAILDAPGAVVVTSTRPDNLTVRMRARRRIGPVAIFDPQHLAEGVPAGMRWLPIRGCESPQTAMIRATGLATGLSAGGVDSRGFWEGKTRAALQLLLHAAAIDDRPPSELFRWTLDPKAAADAVAILNSSPMAASGWAESLEAMIDSDPRTRDSIWQGVSLALGSLADLSPLPLLPTLMAEEADQESRSCPCSKASPKPGTNGTSIRPTRSGTPRSSR